MEVMQKVAHKHDLVCLLHEKPFKGVNGSGKHNNWSIATDTGKNLFNPGSSPMDNAQFLTFLAAVIKAVDEYQELLRICVATAGNDHRLGAAEAPPAIVSMFLGEDLEAVLDAIITDDENYIHKGKEEFNVGVSVLPKISKDATDRNRTSPFAFTGNKFEFRMVGASDSISDANVVLNTIVAESLRQFADRLESAGNFEEELHTLIKETITKHKRIIFSGNSYSKEWEKEAEKRGLYNLKTTADALTHFVSDKNIELFARHGIFTEVEMRSRHDILLEIYNKTVRIEARTIIDMIKQDVVPAALYYVKDLSEIAANKKELGISITLETKLIKKISDLSSKAYTAVEKLEADRLKLKKIDDNEKASFFNKDVILKDMAVIREYADELEKIVANDYWPYPTYADLLFGVK
jgi:glutamine synthetase